MARKAKKVVKIWEECSEAQAEDLRHRCRWAMDMFEEWPTALWRRRLLSNVFEQYLRGLVEFTSVEVAVSMVEDE